MSACAKTNRGFANRGFTLIEVLVATGLLIALCAGASMLLSLSLRTIDGARQRTLALVLARAKLEQLVSLTWSVRDVGGTLVFLTDDTLVAQGPASVSEQFDYVGSGSGSGGSRGGAMFERRAVIERRGSGAAELLIVEVRVRPLGVRGNHEAVSISGARLRRGA